MSARHFLSLALSFGVLSCSGTAHQLTPGMLDQNVYCYGNVDEGLWCVDEVDLWSCDAIAARTNKCTTTPTGSDNWSCKEVDGRAVCTMAGGGDYSGPGWDCDYDEEMAQTMPATRLAALAVTFAHRSHSGPCGISDRSESSAARPGRTTVTIGMSLRPHGSRFENG